MNSVKPKSKCTERIYTGLYKNLGSMNKISFFSLIRLIVDCMVFHAVFNSPSVISRRQVHLSMAIFFPRHWLLSHIAIVETTDSTERGMNPVTMTINNPRKEYWPSRRSNQFSSPQHYRLSYC